MIPVGWPILWSACFLVVVVSGVLALRFHPALLVGRITVGVLMIAGGATFNLLEILSGHDYSGFADQALFRWVRTAWEAVVPPNAPVLIGLLVVFEAATGVLVLIGGRATQVGLAAAALFHLGLVLFSPFIAVYAVLMVPALLLLLVAERRWSRLEALDAVPDDTDVHPPVRSGPR